MPDRFDRFSSRARRALTQAQEEAQRFNHPYIGTEHLLLALLAESDGGGARHVLSALGVDCQKVRKAVEFIIDHGDKPTSVGEIGPTGRAKKVIELAVDASLEFERGYIGTEHLLIGLVREGEGIAAGVLDSLGVNLRLVHRILEEEGMEKSEQPITTQIERWSEVTLRLDALTLAIKTRDGALQDVRIMRGGDQRDDRAGSLTLDHAEAHLLSDWLNDHLPPESA